MRPRTVLATVLVLVALVGAVSVGLSGVLGSGGQLSVQWTSDTARGIYGNHHAPAVAPGVGGNGTVFAPISGRDRSDECELIALSAADGSERWAYPIPPANCTIHSVADPTVADFDDDGSREVLAATTEQAVVALDPRTGRQTFRHELSDYGYTQPIVADLTGDGSREVIVVDVQGTVFVVRPNGTTVWTERLDSYTWGQPAVGDFTGDGSNELLVGLGGSGNILLFDADGTERWNRSAPFDSSITWMTTGDTDGDGASEAIVATDGGTVAAVDGASGDIEWRREFGAYAAVHAFGDGDGDGDPDVYAVARDGKLRGLNARDGTVEWETTLTNADVQMTPPPAMGDLDGDGSSELAAVTNDGIVSVVDPTSGDVLATYEREGDVPIYVHPTVADADADGAAEIYVIYGDGRVVALSYTEA